MIVHHTTMLDNAGITFLAHLQATILHWINILLRHYATMLNQHLCAPCNNSLLLRHFVFHMAEASAKRVTGDEPQGTTGRVLLPAFLCAHVLKRDVWVRGRCNNVGPICQLNTMQQSYVGPTCQSNTMQQCRIYIRPAWRIRYKRIFFRNFSNDQHNN